MEVRHDPLLATLSILVAIFASYVALNLAGSVTHAKGRARVVWLACGALAMGVGIWSMHFIGMLAFEMPGMAMAYDVPLMILSIVVAVGASALGLFIGSRPVVPMGSVISGGIAMAAAINGMHYIGMYSMRMAAEIHWNVFLVVLSIVIALVASFSALLVFIRLRNRPDRVWQLLLASTLMGFAISGMHYTGMFAATFVHTDEEAIQDSHLLVSSGLAIAVVVTTLLILGLALGGSIGQRLLARRRKAEEEKLTKSEERFRLLVEAVKDYAIFMLGPDGGISTWNDGAERITGYRADEAIGKHVSIFYSQKDASKDLRRASETGHFETEGLRLRKDGSVFWANVVVAPLVDEEGHATGYSMITRDVTALKEAEARMKKLNEELEKRVESRTSELQRRETQLRTITDALPVLVGQVDRDERILFANEAFCKWFGRTKETVLGVTFKEILGEPRYSANRPFIERVLNGEVTNYERRSESGETSAVLSITFVPELDGSGQVAGFILLASDITKHKEIEEELKKAKEAAEVANTTKSAFLANMSHEIRTPLGAVLGFSELILDDELSASERVNSIEVIKRNGRLLSTIINDILDLSKVEAGKLDIEKVEVPFVEVMTEIGTVLNLEAAAKGIKLVVTSEGMTPSSIKTDPLRLRQILLNVVGNAIKFTDRGSVEVSVRLINDIQGAMKLAFIVKDTGVGIKPEKVERLFAPFSQADVSTTRKFGGTGLGLALSKRLAQALGGDVVLSETAPRVGSTFVITIDPGNDQEVLFQGDVNVNAAARFPLAKLETQLRDIRVLVVDDSLDNQALIRKLLRVAGAIVDTASNGREGVEKALAGDYKLILMDLQMPEMDGYEATKELRRHGFRKPIIALTAHAMKEERRRCLESGFDDHLTKPIDRESLLHALSEYSAS